MIFSKCKKKVLPSKLKKTKYQAIAWEIITSKCFTKQMNNILYLAKE